MRFVIGYWLKVLAFLQAFGGLVVAVHALAEGRPWDMEQLSIGLLLVATAQPIWWAGRWAIRAAHRKRREKCQNRLLRLAWKKGGCLTVLEAAVDGKMTVQEAEELLCELAHSGHAEMRVSETGVIVYQFPGLIRLEEKYRAKRVDDL